MCYCGRGLTGCERLFTNFRHPGLLSCAGFGRWTFLVFVAMKLSIRCSQHTASTTTVIPNSEELRNDVLLRMGVNGMRAIAAYFRHPGLQSCTAFGRWTFLIFVAMKLSIRSSQHTASTSRVIPNS